MKRIDNRRLICALLAVALMILPIQALAASVKMPGKVGMLYVGQSYTIRPKVSGISSSMLLWESNSAGVAAVNAAGTVTGVSEGLALIRASYGSARAVCGVVVVPRVIELTVGGTHLLPCHDVLSYLSSDPSVVEVSDLGVVTGVRAGQAKVAVICGNVRKVVTVNVTDGAAAAPAAPQNTAPAPGQSRAATLDAASQTDQIVLVEYTGGSDATVSFHEKKNGLWTEVASTYGYVGRNGVGKTVEGDKKTPLGTYNLTTPFGIKDDPGAKMSYTKVTQYHYWCGASSSKYYNQLCDSRVNGRAATSSDEKLINYGRAYYYCMFIDYNAAGVAHKGSCIFLHCIGSNKYTAGCVAIPEEYMRQAIRWARSGCKIVIVAC